MAGDRRLVFTCARGAEIYVERGNKSPNDFVVRYLDPNVGHLRTPKHIHLVVDLYMKSSGDRLLTAALVDHILGNILARARPSQSYPPQLQVFSQEHVPAFKALEQFGEYPLDFLLVVLELIIIQEKTNYPRGTMNLELFRRFREGGDIFSVVSLATFRGR